MAPYKTCGLMPFFTPCLVVVATLATAWRQLGFPLGGTSFTVALYILLDFALFRFGLSNPRVSETMRSPSARDAQFKPLEGAASDAKKRHEGTRDTGPQRSASYAAAIGARSPLVVPQPVATLKSLPPAAQKGLRVTMPGTEMYVNSELPIEFENDFFKGRMLFLLNSCPPDPKWGAHFEGKNRAFEMQIQGQLKSLPQGEVYMGGELKERPKQGLVTQTLSKIVMSFAKQMVKSLHYSFGEKRALSDPSETENPHVTFPLYRVMDWFVATPQSEAPPTLGGELPEPAEERAARRSGKSPDIAWSTDVVYTMCFYSNTVNFQDWTVINVPGQGTLDLNTFLCKQPVSVVVYDFTATSASAAHKARDKKYMFQCTISNECPGHVVKPVPSDLDASASVAARLLEGEDSDDGAQGESRDRGPTAVGSSEDEADQESRPLLSSSLQLPPSLNSTGDLSVSGYSSQRPSTLSSEASPRRSIMPSLAVQHDKGAAGKNLIKSGDVLPLLMGGDVTTPTAEADSHGLTPATLAFLGEGVGGGGATMRRGDAMPAGVQIVKVGGGVDTFRSDFLYEGDVIVLHHPGSRKFVTIGRAWALGWSSKTSSSKIHFVIRGIDGGRPLAQGQAFSLSSRRWSDWDIGVARQESRKLGGRGMGCINRAKRRNTTRYSLLTLVARPWFDPGADLESGDAGGVIPALEAEADAITISVRDPFEGVLSADEEENEDDDGEGSGGANNDDSDDISVDEGSSDSDLGDDSDSDKAEGELGMRPACGDGIAAKALRAMACYSGSTSSLKVSVPAWVEMLHRGRRQGQLAFVVAAQGVPDAIVHASPSKSVRLMSHELSEIQRWEASFRGVDAGEQCSGTTSPSRDTAGVRKDENRTSEETSPAQEKRDALTSSSQIQRSPGQSQTRAQATSRSLSLASTESPEKGQCGPRGDGSARVVNREKGTTVPYKMLCRSVTSPGELDRHFLSGSSAGDLGVVVGSSTAAAPLLGSAVARCLWESHWREEWAVLYPSHLACYPPLSRKPVWILPLKSIYKASAMSDERCPFPGLRCLRLETVGRAHYLCFASRNLRDDWLVEIVRLTKNGAVDVPSGLELRQDPRELYVLKTTKWRMPPRFVLNARRPGFDLPDGIPRSGSRSEMAALQASSDGKRSQSLLHQQQQRQLLPWQLAAEVLRSAFRVSADLGNKRLVPFLDRASIFRRIDLSSLDLESEEALCFFANLYHLIVRHMLLVLGPPPSAKEWPSSYTQVSYEVGGDVFSLQELEHCVLRGRLPRPSLKDLPKRFPPLPPEGGDHFIYSLGKWYVSNGTIFHIVWEHLLHPLIIIATSSLLVLQPIDSRISLFLNNGSQSNPNVVVLLCPGLMDEQLNHACQLFVDHTVKTDAKRRQIRVHKVFQLYARDLQPRATSKDMVRYGLRFAGRGVIHELSALDVDISQTHIRYHPYQLKCHETMTLVEHPN